MRVGSAPPSTVRTPEMRNRPAAAVLAVPALVLAALSLPAGGPAARAVSISPVPGGHISVGAAPAPAESIPAGAVVLKVSPASSTSRCSARPATPRDVTIAAADYNQEVNPATGTPYGTEGSARGSTSRALTAGTRSPRPR